ncbi:hypothetical protein H0H93_003914 [Arthromyces matolae]|nr:hypothetical protein H0H93_003914 [Arthromyces matolae]
MSPLGWLFNLYVKILHRCDRRPFAIRSAVYWFPFGLFLKLGRSNFGPEADTLRFIRKHTSIPVPWVAASASYGKKAFTLMKYIEGEALSDVWPDLNAQQRAHVIAQLRGFIAELRSLSRPPHVKSGTICSLNGLALRDSRLSSINPIGPYVESDFNDRLVDVAEPFVDRELSEPIRARMRNDHRIVFTHGDLTPRNIIMRGDTVAAIVDWEESGWLPEHWELVKAKWSPGMERDSGWDEAIWGILGHEQEGDYLIDRELSRYMVGAF